MNLDEIEFKDKCSTYFNSNLNFNLNEILLKEKRKVSISDFNIEIDENKISKSDEKKKKKSEIEIKKSESEKKKLRTKRNDKIKKNREEILKAIQINIKSDLAQEIIKIFPLNIDKIQNFEFREVRNRRFMNQNNNLICNTEYREDRFKGHCRPFPY